MQQLKLVIPGLIVDQQNVPSTNCLSLITVNNLEKILARSDRRHGMLPGRFGALGDLFGLPSVAERDAPVAALSRLGDGGLIDTAWWFHLDPVYLRPDRDSLVLFSNEALEITMEEARGLASEVMAHFSEQNWHIEVLHPKRWYLRLPADAQIRTHELANVIGRHVFQFLPSGEEGPRWHAWLNEVQMLLHNSVINEARQAKGQLPINALWLWGGGQVPDMEPRSYKIYGAEALERGIANLTGASIGERVENFDQLVHAHTEESTPVVMLDDLEGVTQSRDIYQWAEHVNQLESRWFAPIRQAMKANQVKQLSLYRGDGSVFESHSKMQRRFWRKRQSLLRYN